jgi:hypothetical protein
VFLLLLWGLERVVLVLINLWILPFLFPLKRQIRYCKFQAFQFPGSALVYVRKKNGTLRLCQDFRKLNEITEHDSYPTRPIPSCIESLHGSKWFSSLDMASDYWQVPMDPKDAHKTAFLTGEMAQWRRATRIER